MKTLIKATTPTMSRLTIELIASLVGTDIADASQSELFYSEIGTTTNLNYETLYTAKYTIDENGILNVINMYLFSLWFNDNNARSKLQVSGDGGITWTDITDDIINGIDLEKTGPGLWITNISIGTNMFQFRILGKSTDGNVATIKLNTASYIDFMIQKKI